MALDKRAILLARIIDATQNGTIDWQKDSSRNSFVASFSTYSVRIRSEPDPNSPEDDYNLAIIDGFGDVVEEFDHSPLVDNGIRDAYSQLKKLHEMARRRAMGVETALDSLIKEISSPKPRKLED